MRIRVIGAGALGMLAAASLHRAGAQVELVARTAEQAALIRKRGLLVTVETAGNGSGPEGRDFTAAPQTLDFEQVTVNASGGTEERLPDVIMLMVKQTAITNSLALGIKTQLKPGGKLICFQNGIGHMEVLGRHIPSEQLITAVTTEGAFQRSPRHVSHTGSGMTWLGSEALGAFSNEAYYGGDLVKKLQSLLEDAGFDVYLSNNIISKVWNKLMINAVINPLTAVLQVRNGLLPDLPASLLLMRSLYDEGTRLAERVGIELAPDLWEQLLAVCERTANNRSSMLQDVLARRVTELEAITGGLLKEADRAGMELPTHQAMYRLVRAIEQQWERN